MKYQQTLLSDLFDIGSSKRVLKSQWRASGIPFYRGREVTKLSEDGYVENELFIDPEHFEQLASKSGVPSKGDIIITAIGTIGNTYIVKENDKFYFKDASVLWLKKKSQIVTEYINWWFKSSSMKSQLDEGNGATVDTLTIKKLHSLIVPVPPMDEQKRIVAMLDEAFADIDKACELTEQNLKNARELFESYLAKIFDESKKDSNQYKLEDISGGVFTGPFGSLLHKSDYVTGGIPIVNPAHITEQGINIDDRKTIKIEKASELRAYTMREGDIVIGRRGEMGRCAVVGENESGYICGTGSFVIRASKRFHSDYLVSYLRHSRTRRQLEKIAGGAVMPNLSNKQLSALKLYLPTIDEQVRLANQIRNVCNQIEKVSTIYESKIDSLNSLRTSLLKKVFTSRNAII